MTKEDREKIRKIRTIARRIRRKFEKIANSKLWPENLCGLCGRAATQIFLECRRVGIPVRLAYSSHGHGFCVYKGYYIDVTATQFGDYPKVLVRKIKNPKGYHHIDASTRSLKKMFQLRPSYFGAQFEWKRDREIVRG